MKQLIARFAIAAFAAETAFGNPAVMWSFNDGNPGERATTLVSGSGGAPLPARAGVYGEGTPPLFDSDTPAEKVWDGGTFSLSNPHNRSALLFTNRGRKGALSPAGGEVSAPGAGATIHMADLTVEAFVKVKRQMPHHALIASKRRNGQSGATWSLSIDPQQGVRARFDTQIGAGTPGFNQSVATTCNISVGEWHHVAMTFDHATRAVAIYVDFEKCGEAVAVGPLVYDDSALVFGRGLDGWLDEVRITPEVLRPEQFLRATKYFNELKKPQVLPHFLDQTHSRVQSALRPGMARIGTLIPKSAEEVGASTWSLGCETLDRDLASWDAYKGYLEQLGIKKIRLQGGWNRTEKKKGEYDFRWLDKIVEDAIARGLEVCLETSYNNRLYEPRGATGPGGLLPSGEETLAAWDKWVEAMVRHYAPKGVKDWMMYNEPNLNKGNSMAQIVENNIRTAEIIKRVDPEARIAMFVLSGLNLKMLEALLIKVKARGKLALFDSMVYHGYSGNPDRLNANMKQLQAMVKRLAPELRLWQGEAGCASEEVQYALSGIGWTEYSHAKWNARRMLCDFGNSIESTVFTISDLSYHKDFISRYGLLKTAPDNSIIKVKTAYYTVQNVVSVFNGAMAAAPGFDLTIEGTDKNLTWFAFRDRRSGLNALALWDGTEIPSNDSDIELVDLRVGGGGFKTPVWVDIITGNVYEIPAGQMSRKGDSLEFKNIPVYDGPGVIIDRSLLTFEPAREKKKLQKPKKVPTGTTARIAEAKMVKFLLAGTQQPAPAVVVVGRAGGAAIEVAGWLNDQGVHAFVVKAGDRAVPEVLNVMAYIRSRAAEWQIKTGAVGVMGLGGESNSIALGVGTESDFTVLVATKGGGDLGRLPKLKKGLFLGKQDAWRAPLSAFLEERKGQLFDPESGPVPKDSLNLSPERH